MPDLFSSVVLAFGIGTCGNQLDYCPDPVGKAAIDIEIISQERHAICFEAMHLSKVGDGEPRGGDRGTEIFFLEYRFRLK